MFGFGQGSEIETDDVAMVFFLVVSESENGTVVVGVVFDFVIEIDVDVVMAIVFFVVVFGCEIVFVVVSHDSSNNYFELEIWTEI